jgi:hypothetical protein
LYFGPSTTFALGAESGSINGDLTAGTVTVLSAADKVTVRTAAGQVVELNAGETASAGSANASRHNNYADNNWVVYALIFGGAVAALIFISRGDNDTNLGGQTVGTSPIR